MDTPPTIARWNRYGHDRWYVTAADGSMVGFWNAKTGTTHPEDGATDEDVLSALDAHHAQTGKPEGFRASPAPVAQPEPVDQPAPVRPFATSTSASAPDLADRKPGASARKQADSLRAHAPVRTFMSRLVDANTPERAWRIGADGEELLAKELAKLGPEWRVLHAVPFGPRGADIDHVLIGPTGVYIINTKHHPGAMIAVNGDTVTINDSRYPYVKKSREETRAAGQLLGAATGFAVPATGIVAFVRVKDIVVTAQPASDVMVLGRFEIRPWLGWQRKALSPAQIEKIYDAARQPGTWRPDRA